MLLTGIAWGVAYTTSVGATVRLTLLFVFVHFVAVSLVVATGAFFLVGRLLGPGIAGLPGRRRQQGLFTRAGEGEQLEFGYCFDVSLVEMFYWDWKGWDGLTGCRLLYERFFRYGCGCMSCNSSFGRWWRGTTGKHQELGDLESPWLTVLFP